MERGMMLSQARIEAMTAAGYWPNRTALDGLAAAVAATPDKVFLTDHNSAAGTSTSLTYRQLDRLSRRIAAALVDLGVERGDVVALQLPNWWEFVAIHLACLRVGAITNPLQPIFRERELGFMLEFAETAVLFVPAAFRGFEYPPMIAGLRDRLPALRHVFAVGGAGPDGFAPRFLERRWEDEVDTDALTGERALAPDEVAEICYTSGTTGQPKGVMHTSNTLLACTSVCDGQGLSDRTVALMASPLSHQTGFLYGFLHPLMLGARTVFMDVWEPAGAARLIHDEGVTFTMGATPFLSDLSRTPALERYPPRALELFVCAGAPIPRVLAQSAAAALGARIAAGWGMSENGLVTLTQPDDPPEKIFGTDGRPWAGHEVRVVDEDGAVLPAGAEGRLQTRGAANFVGYLKRPEAYGIDDDGWFDTGDIAVMDADGYIRITSRAKDIIIRGGENVPVVEVEEVLYRHPAVQDAAVVAMPDPRLGERGCAFVSLAPGGTLSFEDLRAHLEQAGLARNYWPERLEIVDTFPRTPSGKIQKFRLREIARDLTAGGG